MPTIEELVLEVDHLRRRLGDCEAVLEIQALKARYGELVDRRYRGGRPAEDEEMSRLAAGVAELFTEDGTWDGGHGLGIAVGRPAIAERLRHPTLSFGRHFFMNPRIEADGDTACGRWDLLSPCRRSDGSSYWMSGYEDDEYARVDGRWLHRSMKLTTVFMSPVGEGWSKILD